MDVSLVVILVVILALFFDFTNGFHDTANAMATPIATGAIKPKPAVALAAVLNLVGAFLSVEVAQTISGGLIREGANGVQITPEFVFAGLVGAVLWNLLTWLLGLPSSSSHALFGGLIGAAIVGSGIGAIDGGVVVQKILLPALVAPAVAGTAAFLSTRLAYAITAKGTRGSFRAGQLFSASLVALSHGTNDAQKTMGVITLVLVSAGMQQAGTPPHFWVILSCALAIAIGTYSGGWRIIRTMGRGITEIKPVQGFSAEVSTASAILASSHLGFALSTTQVASGSVLGSGLGRRGSSVQWGTAGRIALAWLLTLPSAGIIGAVSAALMHVSEAGFMIVAIAGMAGIAIIFVISQRSAVTHKNALSEVEEVGETVHRPRRRRGKKSGGSKGKETRS
ncbi:inorganic phosphate transporter [Devriesea agamarum]|uniref:inorganic phosphate transporter n=1 Tax=Devriesea agamarum TaxID=472569 RepID=UPI00071C8D46|nr:inorganic phosphate transporter [Devriesea agamarum]